MDQIIVPARTENLPDVLGFVKRHLQSSEYNSNAGLLLELSVEEAFVNIANYAYPAGEGEIVVGCQLEDNPLRITVQFMDWGVAFNPLEDVSLINEEKELGGWGIFLIKKYVDHVDYEYQDGKNILTLQKKLE